MNILVLANNDVGLYQFRKELITELIKQNEVTISLPYGDFIENFKEIGCRFIDVRVDRRGINLFKDMQLFNNYRRMIKSIKPDMVITYTIKPNIYGGYACRLANIPYAANITGLGCAFQNKGLLRKIVVTMYKIALKKVKVAYFENLENQKTFVDEGIIEQKKSCLLNGAGVNIDHYTVADYPQGEKIKFLFIGRVMKEKGIDELLWAMKKLWGEGLKVELDILGTYEENYKETVSKYEEAGWLNYYGYQKDVRPFILNTHCLVLPSWHEGMANVNLECAASGRPVITSNIYGCLETIEDGISGYLVKRQNADDLYKVMKQFMQLTYDERKAMGIAGRKRMEEVFDKKNVIITTYNALTNSI